MRKVVFLWLMFVMACSDNDPERGSSSAPSEKTAVSLKDSVSEKVIVEKDSIADAPMFLTYFNVSWNGSYCGGAPPSEEMLADIEKLQPYKNSALNLFREEDQLYYLIRTDANGYSQFMLPAGHYRVYLNNEFLDEDLLGLFNPQCDLVMKKVWKKFELKSEEKSAIQSQKVSINLHFECDPCDPSIKMRP